MGTGRPVSTRQPVQVKQKWKQRPFIPRFLHAFRGNECVIVFHIMKWCLGSKIGCLLVNGSRLYPFLLQSRHSMFSFPWGPGCTDGLKGFCSHHCVGYEGPLVESWPLSALCTLTLFWSRGFLCCCYSDYRPIIALWFSILTLDIVQYRDY